MKNKETYIIEENIHSVDNRNKGVEVAAQLTVTKTRQIILRKITSMLNSWPIHEVSHSLQQQQDGSVHRLIYIEHCQLFSIFPQLKENQVLFAQSLLHSPQSIPTYMQSRDRGSSVPWEYGKSECLSLPLISFKYWNNLKLKEEKESTGNKVFLYCLVKQGTAHLEWIANQICPMQPDKGKPKDM